MEGRRCRGCGFDSGEWSRYDALSTLSAVSRWWRSLAEAVPAGDPRQAELAALTPEVRAAAAAARGPAEAPDGVLAEHLHAAWHALAAAAAVVHRGAPPLAGTVRQVNGSGGGVPKLPVEVGWIGYGGLVGDRQADRRHHGRPWQALCLWSAEVIAALQAEGHPIGPGSAGENLTLAGLDWARMTPGRRLRVGQALVETTAYTTPCAKIARWFADGDVAHVAHERHPGRSRIYARVLEPGAVLPGDPVVSVPVTLPVTAAVDPDEVPALPVAAVGRMEA